MTLPKDSNLCIIEVDKCYSSFFKRVTLLVAEEVHVKSQMINTIDQNVGTLTLTINGQEVKATQGMTVLEAALAADIYIPTLCYHPDLEPYGGCRMCVVEIEKMRGLPTACTTPAADGMVVRTDSPAIKQFRQGVLELILSDHPSECLLCNRRDRCEPYDICLRSVNVTDRCVLCPQNGRCELQTVVDYVGISELHLPQTTRQFPIDDSNPFFDLDRNKCILCARCVRTCKEITCVGAIDLVNRGFNAKVATSFDKPLLDPSNCRSCGECVVHCPTGALAPKAAARADTEVKTTCPYCAVGCQMYLGVKDGRIIEVRGDPEGPSNEGRLCVKGRFGIPGFVHHEDRLKTPLIKRDGRFVEASWDEALTLVAEKLKTYKPDEIGLVSSARSTNEANYIMQKFGRAALGTNSIDHCARL
jgi:predicted molibdopterin-dependent oxidoreductase YjgC